MVWNALVAFSTFKKSSFPVIQRPYHEVTIATCSLECHKRPPRASLPSLPRAFPLYNNDRNTRQGRDGVNRTLSLFFASFLVILHGTGAGCVHHMEIVPPAIPRDPTPAQTPRPTKPTISDTFLVRWGNFLGEF